MSPEVTYSLGALVLFLVIFFVWPSTPSHTHSHTHTQKEERVAVDSLSPRASAVRLSLGVPQKKLLECSPLSIVIVVDNVIASRSVPSAPLEFLISPTALLSALSLLCEFADICFVISACTDEQEQQARELLQTAVLDATAALSRPLRPHRILFYSTQVGKTAIVRQILPDVFIEADPSLCETMCPFVESVIQVSRQDSSTAHARGGAWKVVDSWEHLWSIAPALN